MKNFSGLIGLVLLTSLVFPPALGTLTEVMQPSMIAVDGNELYVVDGPTFYVYSLKDLKLLRKFGKKGEGPGELMVFPFMPNKITVLEDRVFVTGLGKAISFSKDGKYIKEFKTHQQVFQLIPAGKNFVARELVRRAQPSYSSITLYNSKMEKLKELYRQDWVTQGTPPRYSIDMLMDFTSIAVWDGKIYIEQSPKGFIIDVFDSDGNKLYRINNDYQKRKITGKDKQSLEQQLADDPSIKNDLKSLGGWKEAKKLFKLVYPDYYPPIKDIEVSGGKLYVRTYNWKGDKGEYLVMDLKGNLLKTIYLSRNLEEGILARIAGGKLYTMTDGKLYFLKENEEEEVWELHIESMQ